MVHLDMDQPRGRAARLPLEMLYQDHIYRVRQMLLAAAFASAGLLAVMAAMVFGV